MVKKDDVKAELTKLGIKFDDTMTTAQLSALLPDGDSAKDEADDEDIQIEMTDPEVYKPVELPLLIKPAAGQNWKNSEQAEYAKILNAAAYCRPEAWSRLQRDANDKEIPNSAPKHVEIKRLTEIGNNPSRFYFYTGTIKDFPGNITIKNSLAGGAERNG